MRLAKEVARARLLGIGAMAGWLSWAGSAWAQEATPFLPSEVTAVAPPSPSPAAPPPTDDLCKPFWLTHPPYPVLAKAGFWPVLPTGPGYYSLRDALQGSGRENPPPFGYNRFAIYPYPFFDADFRYVDDPKRNQDVDLLEKLHRIHVGDDWLIGTGGEFRYRLNNEINSRGTGIDNRYDLTRFREFVDVWYRDNVRIYAEILSAQSFNQDLAPLAVDRDYFDFLNLFIDLKVFEDGAGVPVYVRGGRQELAFGSQRLISPLDWVNTRRTFEGVRAFRHSAKFDVDLFWVQPVVPNASRFDSVDRNQNFAGLWTTYRPNPNTTWDLYWLYLDNANHYRLTFTPATATFGRTATTPFSTGSLAIDGAYNVHTLGTRLNGNYENFLYDFEPMLQLGSRGSSSIIAGAAATGVGYYFKGAPWNPTFWTYYDWASGSHNPLAGQLSTFNQLFPFGHPYFGWLDFIGRQNIQDLNFNLWLYPSKWITTNLAFHMFRLSSATDALYNTAGAPSRFDPTGRSGTNVGDEIDCIFNFHLTKHQDIMCAYGHLFFGNFMKRTGPGNGADTTWLMYNVRW
jgi:hypothetical protein